MELLNILFMILIGGGALYLIFRSKGKKTDSCSCSCSQGSGTCGPSDNSSQKDTN